MIKRHHVIAIVALVIAAGLGGLAAYRYLAPARTASLGEALVGGPFTLTDQNGKQVKNTDFAGHYMLVYFGYTFCPDVCPAELQVMSAALDAMGNKAKDVVPIFITIDPARDTPEVLKQYISNFNPRFVALTGTDKQIAAVAKDYRVYYEKAKGWQKAGNDYLMNHSSNIYLMGPNGKFVKNFNYTTDVVKFVKGLKAAMRG